MRVLIINSVCGIRSTGRICSDIAEVLKKNGHECKIGYGRETVPESCDDVAVRIGNNKDVNIHALVSRIFDNVGHGSKHATKKFLEWIDEYNPDVIHLHNLHGYYINLELLFNYLKRSHKPVIWTLHDCWAFTGHCTYFDLVGCDKWKYGDCHRCPQKKQYPKSFFIDRSKKNLIEKKHLFTGLDNLTIVTPSEWLANLVRSTFLRKYTVKVINNGIDLSSFRPRFSNFRERYGLSNKTIFLGVANYWGRRKGFYDIIKMNEIKSEEETIVLVGLTKKQILNLPEGIIGISRTKDVKELAEIYTAADVFINSTYEDNYPTVNLESQACGTPVVTYKTGGSPESVPDENVVNSGEYIDLLNKAREVAKSSSFRIKCATNFSKEQRFNEYVALYEDLINDIKYN